MQKISFEDLGKVYVDEALKNYDYNKELLLVGYSFTHPAGIEKLRTQWSQVDKNELAIGRTTEQTAFVKLYDVGGGISLIDLNVDTNNPPHVLADMDITNPMGLCYYPKTKELLVGSAQGIKAVSNGKIVRSLNNNLFNQVHVIIPSERGVYAACSSTDSIVEFDPINPGRTIWDWLATEHGFETNKKGIKRSIDRSVNYQNEMEGTRDHTTHINSIEKYNEEYLLATLFHQGVVIKISKQTGDFKVVLDGLTNPHGIHKTVDGFIVSDTRGNRTLILDKNLKVKKVIKGDFDWVQDSIEFKDYYVVGNDNKGRFDIYSKSGKLSDQLYWGENLRKLSSIYKVTGKIAKEIFIKK